jgi:hypothetical protein
VPWAGVAVLAFSLAFAGALGVHYRKASIELARLQEASGLASAAARAPAVAVPKGKLDEQTRAAEAVVRELTVPWGPLVQALERSANRDVALLQLQPDAQSRVLKLTAEARNREAMFDYVRRLAAAGPIAEAHIVSHQVQKNDPQRPIQFALQATLRASQ